MPFVEVDRRILTRCLDREPGAWQDFVDRFVGVFVHVIQHSAYSRSVTLTPDDIEDLCSEIFLTLLKNDFAVLRHFKGRSSLSTYLAVVARRIVIKQISQRRKSEALGHVSAHQSALRAMGANEKPPSTEIENIRELVSQLPQNEAEVVRLYYLEGKSYQEISQLLEISVNSVGPLLHRAKQRMRQMRVASS